MKYLNFFKNRSANNLCALGLLMGLLCFFASQALAAPIVLDKLVHSNYQGQGCLQSSFVVMYYDAVREKQDTYSGTLALCGDSYRVVYGSWVYASHANVVTSFNTKSQQGTIENSTSSSQIFKPSALIQQYLHELSYVQGAFKKEVQYYEAIPDSVSAKMHMRTVTIGINPKTLMLVSIATTDDRNNRTTYSFSKTLFSSSLPEGTFAFAFPKTATVIDKR